MRIERALTDIRTLGPGSRLAIWTNGCPRACPGCVSVRLQKVNPSTEVEPIAFISRFDLTKCDGVTISGGEPFMQSKELLVLLKYLKENGIKDVLVYTGYLLEELKQDETMNACLKYIDVLIDGPYIDALNDDTNNIKGSSNQNIYYFNKDLIPLYSSYIKEEREVQEFIIRYISLGIGIPTRRYIENFYQKEV